MQRTDFYGKLPEDQASYVSTYGPHFSEKLYRWAVSKMEVRDEETGKKKKLEPWNPEYIDEMLKKYRIEVKNASGSSHRRETMPASETLCRRHRRQSDPRFR